MKSSYEEFLKRKKKSNARARLGLLILVLLLILGCGLKKALAPAPRDAASQPAEKSSQVVQQDEKLPDPKDTTRTHDYSILIKKGKFTLYLLDQGKTVGHWNVALGRNPGQKEKSGDMKTPTGTFPVDEIIGIHGTHDPSSIGTRASEGCIRLNNKDLETLKPYVKVGTKVVIEE